MAEALLQTRALPPAAIADSVHIACAAVAGFDVLASWNFRHLASIWARRKISDGLVALGVAAPLIATPEELLESRP